MLYYNDGLDILEADMADEQTPRERDGISSEEIAKIMTPQEAREVLVEFCLHQGLSGLEEIYFLRPKERAAVLVLMSYAAKEGSC